MLRFINRYLGWRNWAVFRYNSVLENVFSIFYIALRNRLFSYDFLVDLMLFILFSMFSTTYGYLVNDLADRDLDRRHGKENTFGGDSFGKSVFIVALFLLLSAAAGLRFSGRPLFIPLWACWILIATSYSVKPIRLKERGKAGLIFVVIAQRVLPALLIFAAFRHDRPADVVIITLYIFFRGLSSDLNHQMEDHRNDSRTATRTYAVSAGYRKALRTFRFSLEAEKALLLLCLLVMSFSIPAIDVSGVTPMFPILLIYALVYGMCWRAIRTRAPGEEINPFVPGRKNIVQFIHHGFPSVVLPLYLLLVLAYNAWIFLPVLLAFIALRKLYSLELVRGSFPLQAIRNILARG